MQNTKRHTDFDPIPEGLEFRQEYLDAALGQYRRTKRAIVFKRLTYISVAILMLISGSVGYIKLTTPSAPVAAVDSTASSTKENSIQKTSPTHDLETGEEVINEHRPEPAVESVEATQDRSSRATDQGDSMSSGVGLPGQLSQAQRKVTSTKPARVASAEQKAEQPVAQVHSTQNLNVHQEYALESEQNQASQAVSAASIPYLPAVVLSPENGLMHGRSRIEAPVRPWSVFAAVGLKLWADHGFHSRPYTPDASAALGVSYRINDRLSALFQTQFNTVSGIADPYVVEQRTYDTGFNSTTYRYYTDRIYETGACLGVQAKMRGPHSIGLGWSTRYLLTADNHIETGIASTFETLQETRVAAKGYVEGFEALRHSIRLNYEYALGKSKSIGVCYEHGLTDITKDDYFGNTRDRNSMLSVYFRLKLIP